MTLAEAPYTPVEISKEAVTKMDAIADANREIEETVRAEWNSPRKRPILIARLGMGLSSATKEAIAGTGVGLKRYLEEYLADRIRVTPMTGRGGAAAPANQTADMSDQEIEALYFSQDKIGGDNEEVPQYWLPIWKGFQSELADGYVRYVLLDAFSRPRVIDVAEGSPLPDNAKIIDRADLVIRQEEGPLPPRIIVHRAIENWCAREHVPLASLLFEGIKPTRQRVERGYSSQSRYEQPSSRSDGVGERASSFMKGLNLLSRDELARINIPADLVLAILERFGSR